MNGITDIISSEGSSDGRRSVHFSLYGLNGSRHTVPSLNSIFSYELHSSAYITLQEVYIFGGRSRSMEYSSHIDLKELVLEADRYDGVP